MSSPQWKPTGEKLPTGTVDPTKESKYAVKPEIAREREAAFAAKRASVLGQVRRGCRGCAGLPGWGWLAYRANSARCVRRMRGYARRRGRGTWS